MGGVGPLVVVEGDPAADAGLRLRTALPGMQVDAFILYRPPEPFDKDVVQIAGFAIHGDFGLGPFQPVGPVERRELAALIGICSIPDDHIDRRRSALFMARSVLREARNGDGTC